MVEGTDQDQWYAWWAAWMGWTLDAFDFTVFLLIMVSIAEECRWPRWRSC
jgi:SHS family lactate transporter-like MFS transporter